MYESLFKLIEQLTIFEKQNRKLVIPISIKFKKHFRMRFKHKVVNLFRRIIFQEKSRHALVNEITDCTFDDVREQLKGMSFKIFDVTSNGYKARFFDNYTEYVLSFTPGGKAIQIELEYWKDMDVKFVKG